MPLDEFQKEVIADVSRNRDPESPFVGGAVIQQHGVGLSDGQDIFTSEASRLDGLVRSDCQALEAAGFTVHLIDTGRSGFHECEVMKPMTGVTTLQWAVGLIREYYAPVTDPQFGYRLHFADLAVNKALAAASRMTRRNFVDLWMLDRHVIPLWRMACGVPGKDLRRNPFSLVEDMSFNWSMAARKDDGADRLLLTAGISIERIDRELQFAMREARQVLQDVRPEHYGRLEVNDAGQPVTAREITSGGTWIAPMPGGALPAFAGMDSEMIAGLIAEHGPEGSRHTGKAAKAVPDGGAGPDGPAETDGRDGPEDGGSPFDT